MNEAWCLGNGLVVDVLSLTVDLIDQREVEVETFNPFSVEHSHLGLVLLILHVFDHIREPHSQPVVTEPHRNNKLMIGPILFGKFTNMHLF